MRAQCTITCRGYLEAEDLSRVDLEALVHGILSEEIRREEFFIEMKEVATGVALGSLHVGPLHPQDEGAFSGRWCVMFGEPGDDDGLWCLSSGGECATYHPYVFCGGETDILASCAVPLDLALAAIRRCCDEGRRADVYEWVDAIEGMNL